MVTDIEGSSRRWEAHPDAMRRAVTVHDAVVRAAVTRQGGRVFKSTGDGVFAAFTADERAIAAMLDAQRGLAALDFSDVGGLGVRMAAHTGAADAVGDDYIGATLNRAARLTAIAHGGQVLVSGTVARRVDPAELPPSATLTPLGRFRLKDLTEPEAVHQLRHPDLRADFPALRSLDTTPNNLPFYTTICIGRDAELAQLNSQLDSCRLITLLGAGGVGKTRLAVQCGAEQLARFPDGVWLVELAALTEAGQIAETICAMLNLKIGGDRTAAEILPVLLRHKQLLIVLDNCEHLAASVAGVVSGVLRGCAGVTILATSRCPLGVSGEQLLPLAGLGLPDEEAALTVPIARAAPAIRLFTDRARRVSPDFTLNETNVAAVTAICRRLDGVALAIELAAARLRMLSPTDLLDRLGERFSLLTGGDRTALPRHQTLRAMVDWSYDLLMPEEALAFARLGVFGGSFTLDAARETIGASPLCSTAVFDLLGSLLDKSLLARTPGTAGETRYRLAETMRLYALEKLADDPGRPEIMQRYCAWLIRLFAESEAIWPVTATDEWIARFKPDLDNLRAGLAWAFGPGGNAASGSGGNAASGQGGNAASGLQLMSLTSELWRDIGLAVEQRHWLRAAEGRIGPQTPDRVAARIGLDIAFIYGGGAFGDKRKVESALDALARYRALADRPNIAMAAARVAVCMASPVDTTAAQPYVDLIEANLFSIGRTRRRAWLLNILAALIHFEHDADRAIAMLEESVAISRDYRDPVNIQIAGINLGEILFAAGSPARAVAEAEAVAASCRETGNVLDLGFTLNNLAAYALVLGDTAKARVALEEAVPLVADIGVELVLIACLQSTGLLAAHRGDLANAARLAGYANLFYQVNAIAREATEEAIQSALETRFDRAEAEGMLTATHRQHLAAEGAAWTRPEAIKAAQRVLASRT